MQKHEGPKKEAREVSRGVRENYRTGHARIAPNPQQPQQKRLRAAAKATACIYFP